jgi:hypothetical protein
MSCENCPYIALLDAAEDVINDFEPVHRGVATARGTIAVNRQAANRVQEWQHCDGQVVNDRGNVGCPLAEIINGVISLATYQAAPALVAPEDVVGQERDAIGQML